ncbi:MAG TPA: hypothetical protein DCQ26_15070 [Marinilabiliales bacterium]|nr:MAG: hypothetical protein A2W84_15995 [Bacteroidetes bacterium GWC2_40_13]OFX72833.1 MAG: hypothetical protein A2W96_19175 [Bacteroidetes bacterium GWD2_40_43]OFX93526.1 MAG: hypothetical protein A2W97_14775 [Bacteroidetes bacterium GWE2_40_63]OFY18324.1 MAG: hypothetical protein A2W88_05075 [Bacteroidetes bacterium GWF2_40_13]HAM99922.1 hypothetical protein [Marinilabiliales bacterium]
MNRLFILGTFFSLLLFSCEESMYDSDGTKDTGYSGLTGDESSTGGDSGTGNGDTIQSGQITAGEWNDMKNWDFWLNLQQNTEFNTATRSWTFFPFQRYCFQVTDANHQPVVNCHIQLKKNGTAVWESKTDNRGMAELWNQLFIAEQTEEPLSATASYQNTTIDLETVRSYAPDTNKVTLPLATTPPTQVDIHFMVDATGSMGDELEYLKVELKDVISRINTQYPNLSFRYGSVFYRDKGDEYLTRKEAFNTDKEVLLSFINNQFANGGGDYPEAVHDALSASIFEQDWGTENKASLCFVLLDAPPHEEPQVISINQYTQAAAAKGIKLIPITASGIDHPTEFLTRSLALATNGTYIFITGHSGIGGEHLEPTVGEYQVEFLNQLLIRVIGENIE